MLRYRIGASVDCLCFHRQSLEVKRYGGTVVQLYGVLLDAHPARMDPSANVSGYVRGFGYGTSQVNERIRLVLPLARCLYRHLLHWCTRCEHGHDLRLLLRDG